MSHISEQTWRRRLIAHKSKWSFLVICIHLELEFWNFFGKRISALIIELKICFAKSNRNLSIKLAAICIEIYWKILTFLLVLTLENVYEHLLSAGEWNYLLIFQWRASKKLNRFQEKIGCTNITVKVNRPIKQKQSVISALNVNTCGLFSSPYAKNSGLTFKCAFVLVTAAVQSSIHIWHLWWAILSQLAKDLCPFHILTKK